MTLVKKLRVKNFKKFLDQTFDFNDDINVIVGDNECGKSSILEALELCLNYCHRGKPITPEVMAELFNTECIRQYVDGVKSQVALPVLEIEAYLEGAPELRGNNNSEGIDAEGIRLRIEFNPELTDHYSAFIQSEHILTAPFELYWSDCQSFGRRKLAFQSRPVNCLFVDPTRLHPTYGRTRYVNSIINSAISKHGRSALNLNFRHLKVQFNDVNDVKAINAQLNKDHEITDKSLKVVADIAPSSSWESNIALTADDVSFPQIGKGEQNKIQIKIAIQNKAKDVDIVMLEEPENHLSHINLIQLIAYIESKNPGKQIFLTTHSSYVLNKLSIDKLCLLAQCYTRMQGIDAHTVKTLKRLPGYDTLRVVLSQKVILVEGPSDELILKKMYLREHQRLPEQDGIDIVVVRGIGFRVYLNIAKALKHPVRVVKDNDGDYEAHIKTWLQLEYGDCPYIKCFSPTDDSLSSLEPALIEANSASSESLTALAKVMLSTQTFAEFETQGDLAEKKRFLQGWFAESGRRGRKVDSAIRVFDSSEDVVFPSYLVEAMNFGE